MRGAKCPPRLPYSLGAMYVRPPRVIRSPLHMSSFVPAVATLRLTYSCRVAPAFFSTEWGSPVGGSPSPGCWKIIALGTLLAVL